MAKSFFDDLGERFRDAWRAQASIFSFPSTVSRGWRNPFVTERERERRATQALYDETKRAFDRSPYAKDGAVDDFVLKALVDACDRAGISPSTALGEALWQAMLDLLTAEGSIFGFPEIEPAAALTLEEGFALRDYLHRKKRFLSDHERLLDIWREKVVRLFEGIFSYLPPSAFGDEDDDAAAATFTAELIDLCESPPEVIERTMMTMFDDDVVNARLLDPIRQQIDRNALLASGIPPERQATTTKSVVLPTAARNKSNSELVDAYLAGTPFAAFFKTKFPFPIPFPARFEHTLVVGGSGHGKTQLLQLLIHHDLEKAKEDGRSIIIIDSQGDLIKTISHLADFDPQASQSLADKILIVDPNDVEYPVCLNMFDWNRERLADFSPLDREKVLNGTIELYEYMFGALLGAELTQKQGVVFKYLARLMMEIPDATIHTLRALMEDGEPFRPYMERLPGTARSFFETRFFDKGFNETRKQILTRLWGVLSNATLERMFSSPRNKVDIFDATNAGKIILINTAKELLKQEGCAIFGRFFVALIAQAAIQRAALPAHERRSTFVYIDEAQDYFDQNIEQLLNQARKYRFGLVLAHQNLDQLSAGLRASIMANTSIKFAGGVSAKDSNVFASEMRCDADFVQGMRKRDGATEFACYIRNLTPQAIGVDVPLGYVESLPTVGTVGYQALIDKNRARYCSTVAAIEALNQMAIPKVTRPTKPAPLSEAPQQRKPQKPETAVPEPVSTRSTDEISEPPAGTVPRPAASAPRKQAQSTPPPEPALMGQGGAKHKYLQQIIKQVAEERKFRAVIEEPILDGAARVDVALSLGKRKIACEISVTTSQEHELGNVEKCLAAGYSEIVLVTDQKRHLNALEKFILPQLEEAARDKVRFFQIENFIAYLDEVSATAIPTEETIRGYKVRVTRQAVSPEDAKTKREALARVIARSLQQQKS